MAQVSLRESKASIHAEANAASPVLAELGFRDKISIGRTIDVSGVRWCAVTLSDGRVGFGVGTIEVWASGGSTLAFESVKTELLDTIIHRNPESDRFAELVGWCRSDPEGIKILREARHLCDVSRRHDLAPGLDAAITRHAITHYRPPPTIARAEPSAARPSAQTPRAAAQAPAQRKNADQEANTRQSTDDTPSGESRKHLPSDLRDQLTLFVLHGGDQRRLRQLIERCATYDNGCWQLSDAPRLLGTLPRNRHWRGVAKDLDKAIKAWRPPGAATSAEGSRPQGRWWQLWKRKAATVPTGVPEGNDKWIKCPHCGGLAQPGGAYAGFWCTSCKKVIPAASAGLRRTPEPASTTTEPASRPPVKRLKLSINGTRAFWGSFSHDFEFLGICRPWVLDGSLIDIPFAPDRSTMFALIERYVPDVHAFVATALKQRGMGDDFAQKNSERLAKDAIVAVTEKLTLSYAVIYRKAFKDAADSLAAATFPDPELRKALSAQAHDRVPVKIWYRNKADAEKVVAHDPTGLRPQLRVLLAHMKNFGNLTEANHFAILDAVERGRYKIVPSTNNGDNGFDLIFF